jgi:hypothetical protein
MNWEWVVDHYKHPCGSRCARRAPTCDEHLDDVLDSPEGPFQLQNSLCLKHPDPESVPIVRYAI